MAYRPHPAGRARERSGAPRAAAGTLAQEVKMLGGAAEPLPTPVSCTTRPDAGTYHLIDFKEVGRPGLEEGPHPARAPLTGGTRQGTVLNH
ncbi:hypothetical protein ACWENQ_44115 [Nonomuraea sp. NPDC004354]